jgi:hypothetical protein
VSKYRVTMITSASKTVEVEADSPEEAAAIAADEGTWASICHQCNTEFDLSDEWDVIRRPDGSPDLDGVYLDTPDDESGAEREEARGGH